MRKASIAADVDSRPLVRDLLSKHASAIGGVRAAIEGDDLYRSNASAYDDLWILRFVLSHRGDVASASRAARGTMKFREENGLNELGDVRHMIPCLDTAPDDTIHPAGARYHSFCGEGALQNYHPDRSRGVVTFARAAGVDMRSIAREMSVEDLRVAHMYISEVMHQIHDEVTRRTGRLTKSANVVDLDGWSWRDFSLSYSRKDAAASRPMEDFYPQLLGEVFFVNAPGWFVALWNRVLVKLLPSRIFEKVNIMPAAGKMKERDLGPFLRYISRDDLPERYGGANGKWPLPSPREMFADEKSQQMQ